MTKIVTGELSVNALKSKNKKIICYCNILYLLSISLLLTFFLLVVTSRLLITLANSLDPDQDQQNVGPDKDPISLCLFCWS